MVLVEGNSEVIRRDAIETVKSGATECKVVATYAANIDAPIDVNFEIDG